MKKNFILGLFGLFLFIGLSSMITMDPPDNAVVCNSDCEILVEAGVFDSFGTCRNACSVCTNPPYSNGVVANCYCKAAEALFGEDEHWGFKNHGKCVNYIKSLGLFDD